MSGKREAIQRYRLCRCSEYEPCNPACSWVTGDLCSSCAIIIEAVVEWMDIALRCNMTGLVREARRQYLEEAVLTERPAKKRRVWRRGGK